MSKARGYIPQILDYDGDDFMDIVLDQSVVEDDSGCWLFQSDGRSDGVEAHEAQKFLWNMFVGGVPNGHYVYNTCSDILFCFNPLCLATEEVGLADEA